MPDAHTIGVMIDRIRALLTVIEEGSVNRAQLEAWVLNAPAEKPNRADNLQGMRSFLALTPEQLEQIVDYLETLQ